MLELQSGAVFGGRYKVVKCIGSGGMGAVYLAKDPRYSDFPVALKVLYPGIMKTAEARERFKTEIIASYRITHRNVVRAYEYFDDQASQAYAMELVDGSDLQVLFKNGAAPIDQAISILRQSAAGLAAIHQRGIIHRDLKPENILVGNDGVVKIADFGVAQMRGDNTGITQAGAMVGTPKYFSPEYIETGDIDQRGDIYAIGVIGFELISGGSPFRSKSQVSLMVERIKQPQPDLSKVVKDCPPDLVKIIEQTMRVALADRYQSAEDLRTDLECLQNGKALIHWKPPRDSGKINHLAGNIRVDSKVDLVRPERLPTPVPFVPPDVSSKAGPHFWLAAISSFFLVILLSIGGYFFLKQVPPNIFKNLDNGHFQGYVQDLAKGRDLKLTIWKDGKQVKLKLYGKSCPVAELNMQQEFSCGESQYQLKVDLSNGYSALGRMRLKNEKFWSRWSAFKVGSARQPENE